MSCTHDPDLVCTKCYGAAIDAKMRDDDIRALQQEKMLRQNLILIRDLCATQHNHDMTHEERRTEMKTIMDTATFALDWKP